MESEIKLVQQSTDNGCMSACIAMVLDLPLDEVMEAFHDDYHEGEIRAEDYIRMRGVDVELLFAAGSRVYSDQLYIVSVPSLNLEGINHVVVMDTRNNETKVFDPNEGREGKRYYTKVDSKLNDDPLAFPLKGFIPVYALNYDDRDYSLTEVDRLDVRLSTISEYRIVRYLDRLRTTHPDIQNLYLYGRCYEFALSLIELMGDGAEIQYSHKKGHAWVYWRGGWWDINGKHDMAPDDIEKLTDEGHPPFLWSAGDHRRLLSPDEEHPLSGGMVGAPVDPLKGHR